MIDYGSLNTTVTADAYTQIDSNTVTCTKPTCTVVFDMEEQLGNQGTASNWFAVCAVLDGNFAPYGCPLAGELPTDYGYIDSRTRQSFAGVTKGTHTVAVLVFSPQQPRAPTTTTFNTTSSRRNTDVDPRGSFARPTRGRGRQARSCRQRPLLTIRLGDRQKKEGGGSAPRPRRAGPGPT